MYLLINIYQENPYFCVCQISKRLKHATHRPEEGGVLGSPLLLRHDGGGDGVGVVDGVVRS